MLVSVPFSSGRRHYHGPHAYIRAENDAVPAIQVDGDECEKEMKMMPSTVDGCMEEGSMH